MSTVREDETLGLSGLRFGLIEPVTGTRPTEARRARLLAVLSLLQAGMTCVGAVESLLFQPADMGRVIAIVLAPTTLGYLVVFALARRGRVDAAAVLTLVLQCAVPTAVRLALRDLDLNAMSSAAWLSIAVLTANATLDTRGVLVAGAATSTCFASALYVSRGTSAELAEGLLFLATTAAATYAYSLHRDGVEATRQAQLRSGAGQLLERTALRLFEAADARMYGAKREAEVGDIARVSWVVPPRASIPATRASP